MKRIGLALVIALALSLIGSSASAQQGATATVNTGNLNVRGGPGINYPSLVVLPQNTVVSAIGRNAAATWVQVRTAAGITGWVNARYVVLSIGIAYLPITDAGLPSGGPAASATVTGAYFLNVRSGPGIGFAVAARLSRGDAVTLTGRNAAGTWAQIRTASGVTGWVNASYLTTATALSALPITDGGTVTPPPATGGARTYVVRPGDTLFGIARAYGMDVWALARANRILNLNQIYSGQVLVIP